RQYYSLYQVHIVQQVSQTRPTPLDVTLHTLASASFLKEYLLPYNLLGVQHVNRHQMDTETYLMHKTSLCLYMYHFYMFYDQSTLLVIYFQFLYVSNPPSIPLKFRSNNACINLN